MRLIHARQPVAHVRRRMAPLVAALALLGSLSCRGEPSAEPESPRSASTWAYVCPDGFRFPVHYRPDRVTITLPAHELVLPAEGPAAGLAYRAADTVFRHGDRDAVLQVGPERHRRCRGERAASSEDAARMLGFDFRGLGQEPGWLVDVDADREIRWIGDYGEIRFATGAPTVVEETEATVVWRAETAGHEITVEVVVDPCRDAMSGRAFTHTVRVMADGRTLDGCGRWLGRPEPDH